MKSLISAAFFCLALVLGSAFTNAADAPKQGTPTPIINKKCPVEGGDVDPAHTVVYKGKTVGFCCGGCDKTFNKDPEKYLKEMAARGDDNTVKKAEKTEAPAAVKAPAKLNKMCLVHPENAVDATETTEYKGRTVGFCCEDCLKAFNADPDKYIAKADAKK